MRRWRSWTVLALVAVAAAITSPVARASQSTSDTLGPGARVYWDQNEEMDFLAETYNNGLQVSTPLVRPYDTNGQMCLFPKGSSRAGQFTTGYNPTLPSQGITTAGPMMNPPVGEAVWDVNGNFTGQTLNVPGPYAGGDIPPDSSSGTPTYNNNGTFVGCAFDPSGNLIAGDLGTAQGTVPPADNGRVIEWFTPNYDSYCILLGPTSGGDSGTNHHVDGTGGLRQPGTMAFGPDGALYFPVAGLSSDAVHGRVLRVAGLPQSATQCPATNGNMPSTPVSASTFIDAFVFGQPFSQGIALDPTCNCWAVSDVLGSPEAVAWYGATGPGAGLPVPGRVPVAPITTTPDTASQTEPFLFTPYGIAFTSAGTLYIDDIHITCVGAPNPEDPSAVANAVGCGPETKAGQILKVTFSRGVPNPPVKVNTARLDFPVSVTVCEPNTYPTCPTPPSL